MVTRRSPKKAVRRVAVAYLRVSKDADAQELGLKAQRRAIGAWARRAGVEVVTWRADQVSGGSKLSARPRLARALLDVKRLKAEMLIVHRLDRFSRDHIETSVVELKLREMKARLIPAEGAPTGDDMAAKIARGVLQIMAEVERDLLRERTKAALAVKRHRGEALGAPGREAYGYRREGSMLVADSAEQATLARARELYAVEGVGLRAVGAALTAEGRTNRKGRAFGLEELSKMVKGAAS
jgi:DNA invertase Pin-like site-specific DNA recombinase